MILIPINIKYLLSRTKITHQISEIILATLSPTSMPSLPTRNQQGDLPQNAFRWYLSSLEFKPSNRYRSILVFIITTLVVSLSILSLKIYQLNWKSSHHNSYQHSKLYFLSEFYRTLCWSFFGHQFLSSVYRAHQIPRRVVSCITFIGFIR